MASRLRPCFEDRKGNVRGVKEKQRDDLYLKGRFLATKKTVNIQEKGKNILQLLQLFQLLTHVP